MKIYEIVFDDDDVPMYAKSNKDIKQILADLGLEKKNILWVKEMEFEYNLDSICNLMNRVHR